MHIQSIPMWRGTSNNYAYLVTDTATKNSTLIDPAHPPEVLPVLASATAAGAIKLVSILNTHHHADHSGGNAQLLAAYPVPLLGGADCPHRTSTPAHASSFRLGDAIEVTALHTPCHTQDSICWLMRDTATGEAAVFTGDTLFIGGCGRFFEGEPAEMDHALNTVLGGLPDATAVYPGHEYTKGNAKFAATVSASEAVGRLVRLSEAEAETPGKSTIADEKAWNVFMRLEDAEVQRKAGVEGKGRAEVMAKLRELKNSM